MRCFHLASFPGPVRSSLAVREFRTASDERAGPGNEASCHSRSNKNLELFHSLNSVRNLLEVFFQAMDTFVGLYFTSVWS